MPEREAVLETVYDVLSRYVPRETLTAAPPKAISLLSLGIASSDVISIVLDLEEHYGVPVEDDEYIHRLKTLEDVVREIHRRAPS